METPERYYPQSFDRVLQWTLKSPSVSSDDDRCSDSDDELPLLFNGTKCARLDADGLSSSELLFFPFVSTSVASYHLYLHIRNKIVDLWYINPYEQLSFDYVLQNLPLPYSSDEVLVKRVYEFLERYGYINFGIFSMQRPFSRCSKQVVVIGAGAAGLAAARQLKFFGFDVLVLEARSRPGGRVHTWLKFSRDSGCDTLPKSSLTSVELGAPHIIGSVGNPIMTLVKQLSLTVQNVEREPYPTFDNNGQMINGELVSMIDETFNAALSKSFELSSVRSHDEVLSIGSALNVIMAQAEHLHLFKSKEFWHECHRVLVIMQRLALEMSCEKSNCFSLMNKLKELQAIDKENCSEIEQGEIEISLKCLMRDISASVELCESLSAQLNDYENAFTERTKNLPREVFMDNNERRIFELYVANLEYCFGCKIERVSLKHLEKGSLDLIKGPLVEVDGGLSSIFGAMSHNLNIQYSMLVNEIAYDANGVKIRCGESGSYQYFHADACICTLPLGVLKEVDNENLFNPQLSEHKRDAIRRLGFGNVNKVVLRFNRVFWDSLENFNRINDDRRSRGEFFQIRAYRDRPIVEAFLSGQAAGVSGKICDDIVIKRLLNVLNNIFSTSFPMPAEAVVTKWHDDPASLGTFSYTPVGCTGQLYDLLSSPIKDEFGKPRVFFGGEHTIRNHHSTLHGAFLSGLREAGRVADNYIGHNVC